MSRDYAGVGPDELPLRLTGVCCALGPGRPLFHGLDLELRQGQIVAVVGPHTSGKATVKTFHSP